MTSHQLPQTIELPSVAETWQVRYHHHWRWQCVTLPTQEITLFGDPSATDQCRTHLIHWLKQRAYDHLGKMLHQLSQQHALPFRQLNIRGQKTRWGSCTQHGNISLNFQLLFLPPHLVQHILLHELAHTRHLNHSTRFWKFLSRLDEKTEHHAREARRAQHHVPTWVR